jgi:hypothetical protein
MNFLKLKTSWSTAELGLLKLCLISLGIVLGIFFYEFLKAQILLFFIVFIITAIYGLFLWIKKAKQ